MVNVNGLSEIITDFLSTTLRDVVAEKTDIGQMVDLLLVFVLLLPLFWCNIRNNHQFSLKTYGLNHKKYNLTSAG